MAAEIFKLVGRITYEGQQKVEAGLTALGKKVEQAQEHLKKFGETAQKVGDKTKEIGEGMSTKVTAPLLALGGLGIKAVSDVDAAMGKLAAATDRTAQDTMELQDAARDLWRNAYGADVNEAAEAVALVDRNMGNLVSSSGEVRDLAENAFILRDAFGYDIQESTRAAAALMSNFGITGNEAFDMITTAAQRGGDYSGELLDSISEYSTQFANMGYSGSQMMGMFVAGAENGIFSLDKLADSVKESFLQITDGGENTKAAIQELGLNYDQVTGDIQKGGDKANAAFGVIMTAIAGVRDEADRNRLAVELMGTPLEDLGPQYQSFFADTKRELQNFTGSTAQAGQELYDNFGTRLTGLFRTVQNSLVPLGGVLLDVIEPAINSAAGAAEKAAKWFQGLSDKNQNLIVYLGLAAAAIGPLLVVVGTLISSFGAVAGAIGAVSLPIWGAIAGVVALIAIFATAYAKSETFRNKVNELGGKIREVFMQGFGVVAAFLQAKLAEIQGWWSQNSAMIMQALQNVANVVTAVFNVVWPVALALIKATWGYIQNVINGAINVITGAIQFFAALFTGNWSKMWAAVVKMLGGAVELIWGLINLSFIGRLLKGFGTFAKTAGTTIKTWATNTVNYFKGLATGAQNAASGMVNRVLGFFTNLWNQARSIFTFLKGFGESTFSALRNTVVNVASNLRASVTGQFNSLLGSAQSIFNSVKNAIVNPVNTARDLVKAAVDRIKGFFSGLSLKMPKISMPKLPHFSLQGKFSLNPPSVPKIGINWYAKGGVFDGDSIIGVGEAGPEAVVPLTGPRMRPFAETIAQEIPGGTGSGLKTLAVQLQVGSRILAEQIIDDVDEMLGRKTERASIR